MNIITVDGKVVIADGNAVTPPEAEDLLDKYIAKTLVRFRTMRDFNLVTLQPGSSATGGIDRYPGLLFWEIPNNTSALPVWYLGNCRSLIRVDVGYCPKIDNVSLSQTVSLKYLIIRKTDAIATLFNSSAVSFATGGKIYVPPALIEEYKVATNWSTHASRFSAFRIAETVAQKAEMLADPTIADGTMIICDVDATYTVKGETE